MTRPTPAASSLSGFEAEFLWDVLTDLKALPAGTLVAIDTETTGLRVFDDSDKVIGISFAFNGGSGYAAVAHEAGDNVGPELVDLLREALVGKVIIYANAQFDMCGLLNFGIDLRENDFFDIMVMAMLVDENNPFSRTLDSLGSYYCGAKKVNDPYVEKEKKTGNRNITPEEMWDYAVMDAELTYRVCWKIMQTDEWKRLTEETDVWENKARFMLVLMEMTRRGILIDTEHTAALEAQGLQIQAELRELMQFNPLSHDDNMRIFITDLKLPVLKRSTKTKKPSFDKEVMEAYEVMLEKLDSPLAKQVKRFRGWNKATSACYTPYLRLLGKDGRLHTTFKLHRTVTGRLSSAEPNLQQIPKETDKEWNGRVKECIIAPEGYVLLSADYSQLELRLLTGYAREESLMQIFLEGRDIFTEMAEALGMTRNATKTFVHSTNYGAGIKKIARSLDISVKRAAEIRADFKATDPGLARLSAYCVSKVEQQGYVSLWTDRRRRFKYKNDGYKAMNSLIQGGSADIVERVMLRLWDELDCDDCQMLLQVHDAVVFQVKASRREHFEARIKEIMEDVDGALPEHMPGGFGVKFAVDITEMGLAA
jgi:DNA polymerase-1